MFRYSSHLFHSKVSFAVRLRLYRHIQKLSLGFHRQKETGYIMARLDDDVGNLDGIMADALGKAAIEVLKAAGFLAMMFFLEPRLATGGCVLVVVVFGVQILISRPLRRRNEELLESRSVLSEAMHQGLSGHYLIQRRDR